MSARLAGTFLAGALLGAGGLWLLLPRPPPPEAPPREEAARPALPCTPGPSLDIAEIRAVVRQELLAAAAASPARAPSSPPAPPAPQVPPVEAAPEAPAPKPPSPEYVDAQRLIEDSLARHTWSVEDRGRMQALMSRLSPPEREALMRRLIVAANRGELRPDVPGPLF